MNPSCPYCGCAVGLRMVHDGGGYEDPEYICQDCFTPTDTGPCFDDLERWSRVCMDAGEFKQAEKLRREAMSAETYTANVDLLRKRIAQMKGDS